MKKSSKIFALIHLLVLVCFILNSYSTLYIASITISTSGHSPIQENYFSIASSILYCPATKTENILHGFNNLLPNCLKNNLIDYSINSKEAELLLFNLFSKYISFSRNYKFIFPGTDIIYPFHYFW